MREGVGDESAGAPGMPFVGRVILLFGLLKMVSITEGRLGFMFDPAVPSFVSESAVGSTACWASKLNGDRCFPDAVVRLPPEGEAIVVGEFDPVVERNDGDDAIALVLRE